MDEFVDGEVQETGTVDLTREINIGRRRYQVRVVGTSCRVRLDLQVHDVAGGACVGHLDGEVEVTDLAECSEAMSSLLDAIVVALDGGSASGLTIRKIRRSYPNAYKPWTHEEEGLLAQRFQDGLTVNELAKELGRRPGGIASRLKRLNLLPASTNTQSVDDLSDYLPSKPSEPDDLWSPSSVPPF